MTDARDAVAFEEALDWRLRESDLDAAGWRAFATWIDASPVHATALARVDAIDDVAGDAKMSLARPSSGDTMRSPRWAKRVLAGGAAVAAGIVAIAVGMPSAESVTEIATRPGEQRTVAFGDGSRVTLNGATLLRYAKATPRSMELARGEAIFTVRHDLAHPFRVTSGGDTIEDVGTVFNVVRDDSGLRVSVAEGSVVFDPKGAAVALTAGRELDMDRATRKAVVRTLGVEGIGGWRSGMLNFSAHSLRDVAQAFERSTGADISVDADLMDRPFTGSVRVSGSADRDVPHLAALIGVDARHDGTRWILSKSR